MRNPAWGTVRSWASGSRSSASRDGVHRMRRVLLGPQQEDGHVHLRVGVKQLSLRLHRPAPGELGPRAGAVAVAADVGEGMADEVARRRVALDRDPLGQRGPEHQLGPVGHDAIQARERCHTTRQPPGRARGAELVATVQAVGHEHDAAGLQPAGAHREQQPTPPRGRGRRRCSAARPPRDRSRRSHPPASRASTDGAGDLRSRRAAAGRAGEDESASARRGHDRLPLAVREAQRVQKHKRRTGPGLSVGDPCAVLVVVEAKTQGLNRVRGRHRPDVHPMIRIEDWWVPFWRLSPLPYDHLLDYRGDKDMICC